MATSSTAAGGPWCETTTPTGMHPATWLITATNSNQHIATATCHTSAGRRTGYTHHARLTPIQRAWWAGYVDAHYDYLADPAAFQRGAQHLTAGDA